MKKILYTIAFIAILFLIPSRVEAQTVSQGSAVLAQEKTSVTVYALDTRVKALENVFEKYGSILAAEAIHYVAYADEYGTDWKLLPAISGLESTFAKRLMPGSYNAYGWGGGYIYFESWEDGIQKINKALSENYYARGADNVWSIGPVYAETPTWAVRVNRFMEEIEDEYKRLSLFSSLSSI